MPHLFGIVVVICKCLVNVGYIKIVSRGHLFGGESTLFHTSMYVPDGDATPVNVRLTVDF
jgi:hypothetical protein